MRGADQRDHRRASRASETRRQTGPRRRRATSERSRWPKLAWVSRSKCDSEWPTILGFVAVHVLLCLVLFDPKLHIGGDNAHYILLSESLLTPFDGYTDPIGPGPPKAHTKYPPGYPMLLAPVSALLGRSVVGYKLVSLLMTASAVAVFCLLTRGWYRRPVWLALCAAFALNPVVVDYSHWILTEATFLFVSLLALFALDRDRDRGLGKWFWIGLAAAVWCFYIRQIGALFLAGASVAYLAQSRWRKFLVHGVIGVGLTVPWLIRSRLHQGETSSYLGEFLLKNIYVPEAGHMTLGSFVARFFENASIYSLRELPRTLVGSHSGWARTLPLDLIAILVLLLATVGVVRRLRTGPRAADLYFVFTLGALFLFVQVASDVRYLVPLVPLILICATDGIQWLVAKARNKKSRSLTSATPIAFLLLLGAVGLSAQVHAIPAHTRMLATVRSGDRHAGYRPAWRSFMEVAEWARDNIPKDAVVTDRKPRLFRLVSGHRSIIYPFSSDTDSVMSIVRTTDYVAVGGGFGGPERYLVAAVNANLDEFEVVFRTAEPVRFVLRVVK